MIKSRWSMSEKDVKNVKERFAYRDRDRSVFDGATSSFIAEDGLQGSGAWRPSTWAVHEGALDGVQGMQGGQWVRLASIGEGTNLQCGGENG